MARVGRQSLGACSDGGMRDGTSTTTIRVRRLLPASPPRQQGKTEVFQSRRATTLLAMFVRVVAGLAVELCLVAAVHFGPVVLGGGGGV